MAERRQERIDELAVQLDALQAELDRTERSATALRGARNALFAELVREEHGIVVGDVVFWHGEQQLRSRCRQVTLRGVVLEVPMRGRLMVQRLNRDGGRMDYTVCVPADVVTASRRGTASPT